MGWGIFLFGLFCEPSNIECRSFTYKSFDEIFEVKKATCFVIERQVLSLTKKFCNYLNYIWIMRCGIID